MLCRVVPNASGRLKQRALVVEPGQRFALRYDLVDPREAPRQRLERALHLQHDPRAPGCDQRRVSHELQRVAETLLVVQQDRFARQVFGPAPRRLDKVAFRDKIIRSPAPFVLFPAALEVTRESRE